MSRPKEYYYGAVKRWIMDINSLPLDRTQANIIKSAYEAARQETEAMPNGKLRLVAIDEILIKKTKNYDGVAQELHYDWRTIQNWVTSFVNLVGRRAGF